ncbi:MAG TPA: sigma-E factor negative regulatory protein [Lysobacter sp.]
MTNRLDSISNHHPLHPRDERETLSALFDGELPGDAARFALKRLDHDADWRETCGRWQMIGDALRGEATSAAPTGFASGVMRMLDAEAQAAVASAASERVLASTTTNSRRRWIGGAALAASVAMAAVLVVRPFSETSSPDRQVASAPTATQMPAPSAVTVPAPTSANNPSPTLIAAAEAPAATANHRAARSPRTATRVVRRQAAPVRNEADEATTVVASAIAAPVTTGRPFHPPVDDIVTRPWPRSVLSGDNAGALTVGFGSTSSTSPSSLYPFEPRLPESQPARPAAEPQR